MSGPFSGVQCLEFAYSMVGSTIGKLSVYHLVHGTEMETWSKEGRQRGSDWHTDNITLYGKNYYVSPKKTLKMMKIDAAWLVIEGDKRCPCTNK